MNRRDFLRVGALLGAATVVDPLELADMLAPRRLYVPGIVMPGTATVSSSMLAACYRKVVSPIYATWSLRVDEFGWLDTIEDAALLPAPRENLIPLHIDFQRQESGLFTPAAARKWDDFDDVWSDH